MEPGERRGGGRVKGQRNRATIEREFTIKAAQEELGLGKSPLAKDVLARVMQYFLDRANEAAAAFLAMSKPEPGSKQHRSTYESAEARGSRYMKLTADIAEKLIGYQSPKLAHTTDRSA